MSNFFTGWINQVLACFGGCLGCYTKSTPIAYLNPWIASASEDFWSTSTHDLEYSTLQSYRSNPSINLPTGTLNPDGSSSHAGFVNHGLIQFNQNRLQWVTAKNPNNHPRALKPKLSWNVNYDTLLGTSRRFSYAVPLSEMVEYLVDNWEHEGLYD